MVIINTYSINRLTELLGGEFYTVKAVFSPGGFDLFVRDKLGIGEHLIIDHVSGFAEGGWAYRLYGPEENLGDFNLSSWEFGIENYPEHTFDGCDQATPVSGVDLGQFKSYYK